KLRANQTNARTLISEVRYLPGVEIRSHGGTGEILHVITASAGSNSVQVLHWVAGQPKDIANNQVRYSLNDHLRSSVLELDQNADLISQEWYYPFGGTACFAARSATEAKYKTVRYSGKERDATGLYYYGFRYYAPWLQRWINPDPAGDVDGPNRYCFVQNSPLIRVDPNGLASQIPKNAHWIWMGDPLPKDFSRNINKFSHINPDYTPTLWISRKTWSEKHQAALENLAGRIIVKNIDEAFDSADIRLISAFERERSGSLHNYAAASDIARVVIVHREGGVYMDTDVTSKFGMPLGQLTAYQGIMKSPRTNAVIAADKGNNYLKSAMEKIKSAYDTNNEEMWKHKRSYNSLGEYSAANSQFNNLYKIKNRNHEQQVKLEGLRDTMSYLRKRDMDHGLGDPSDPKTAPRLRGTIHATGPDMWADILHNVIGHELPPIYFEPIDASAASYIIKPSNLRRDSI
ncbi:RHS repeat-associated core domain protein containing protein, partial [Pseudomonas sp. GM33]|uniref:RHS repeat-associated core domain-containing protein n=1 Tax=Pseudomonas sp. GM33 TaxID=1144329 RepID=UPI00026FF151